MERTLRDWLYRFGILAGGALAASLAAGCSANRSPARAAGVAAADIGTCLDVLVRSIWQGEDVGGPECSRYIASEGQGPALHKRRVQTVCERAHVRAILTGEASTPFTQRACASYAKEYPEARMRKTCRAAARAYPRNLTDVQEALCSQYVGTDVPSETARGTWARGTWARGTWPRRTSAREAAALETPTRERTDGEAALREAEARGTVWSNRSGTVRWWTVLPSGYEGAAQPTPERVPDPVAARAPEPVPAASNPPDGPVASRIRCEDSYIESIWNGRDTSGPGCAAYVAYDGSTPDYDHGRIASACLGVETRALRSNVPMTLFSLQACLKVLTARWSRQPSEPIQSRAGADWNTDPTDTSIRRGLSDAAVSRTVAANWPSIERDCFSTASLSGAKQSAPKTPVVVTLTVGASGQVRSAAARAAGDRDLEICIESNVRSWSFPEALGNTTISIPMSFGGGP